MIERSDIQVGTFFVGLYPHRFPENLCGKEILYKSIESEIWTAELQAFVSDEAKVYRLDDFGDFIFGSAESVAEFLNRQKARIASKKEVKYHTAIILAAQKKWLIEMHKKDRAIKLKLEEFINNDKGAERLGIGLIFDNPQICPRGDAGGP